MIFQPWEVKNMVLATVPGSVAVTASYTAKRCHKISGTFKHGLPMILPAWCLCTQVYLEHVPLLDFPMHSYLDLGETKCHSPNYLAISFQLFRMCPTTIYRNTNSLNPESGIQRVGCIIAISCPLQTNVYFPYLSFLRCAHLPLVCQL